MVNRGPIQVIVDLRKVHAEVMRALANPDVVLSNGYLMELVETNPPGREADVHIEINIERRLCLTCNRETNHVTAGVGTGHCGCCGTKTEYR